MVTRELKEDNILMSWSDNLSSSCEVCERPLNREFTYFLRQQLFEHHGQCVERDMEEWIKLETNLPAHLQCKECGAVYAVSTSLPIYANYSNPNGLTPYSEITSSHSFGSKKDLLGSLERNIEPISLKFMRIPEKV